MKTKSPINAEALEIAKKKGAGLQRDTQIRLYGGEYEISHTVYNIKGVLYIGMNLSEGEYRKFYKHKPVFELADANGKVVANVQKLTSI